MAGFYAAYHGPEGLKQIAQSVHLKAIALAKEINELSIEQKKSVVENSKIASQILSTYSKTI